MRVLIDALTAPGHPRGVGQYVRGLAGSLATIEDVHVLVAHGRWHAEFFAPLAKPGVQLVPLDLPAGGRLTRHAWHAVRLAALTRRLHADIVHVPDRFPAKAPQGASRPPLVVTIHDVAEYDLPEAYGPAQLRFRRWVLRGQLRGARTIVTPSAFSAGRLRLLDASAGRRTTLVHNGPGIDPGTRATSPAASLPARFLLSVGAVQRHKNLPRVVRAFRRLTDSRVGLVLAGGDHNDRAALERAIDGDPRVVRLPQPTDEEIAWLYLHAAGLVFASLYEGFGLPILEAMSFGCPVVTSDRGAMRELAGEAAWLVDPLDDDALHGAMQRLLDDSGMRESLASAGRARAALYSWDRAAAGTLEAYRAALNTLGRQEPSLGS